MVYSAAGNITYAWRRGCELKHVYKGHESKVHLLLPFGPHLISISIDSKLIIHDISEEQQVLHIEFDNKMFKITSICHPITYKDKILLGSSQGTLSPNYVKIPIPKNILKFQFLPNLSHEKKTNCDFQVAKIIFLVNLKSHCDKK